MNKRRSESSNRRKVYLGHPFATLPSTNMLKINQHTTTLSKALLTAGLLGGAALSTLGAGSALARRWPAPERTPLMAWHLVAWTPLLRR